MTGIEKEPIKSIKGAIQNLFDFFLKSGIKNYVRFPLIIPTKWKRPKTL